MGSLPDAVLLDLDDTILDDSGNVSSSWYQACLDCCGGSRGPAPDRVHEAIERTRAWYWSDPDRHRAGRLDLAAARRDVVRLALADIGDADDALGVAIGDRYHALRQAGLRPLADAVPTVQWLRARGCRLALLTNGSAAMQRDKIDRFSLAGLFDVVLIEGELGFGKPDPRIYELALESLGVNAAAAWMVGDNLEWDVAQPQRGGILGIWVDVRGTGLPPGHPVVPDRIVRRLADLRSFDHG